MIAIYDLEKYTISIVIEKQKECYLAKLMAEELERCGYRLSLANSDIISLTGSEYVSEPQMRRDFAAARREAYMAW